MGAFVGGGGKQSGAGGKSNTPPILPRGLNSYEHSVHNARDAVLKAREAIAEAHEAVLQARSFYDYDDSLYARDAEFDDGTLYARDAYGYNFYEEYVPRSLSSGSGGVGGPQLPSGVDPNGLHLFTRLNTVPKAYPPFGSVNHAGLNKLMADLGGQHVDVIHGNPDKGYIECGLTLVDMAWTKTHSNADGYPVYARCVPVVHGERDLYTYMGEYEGGSVTSLCKGSFPLSRLWCFRELELLLTHAYSSSTSHRQSIRSSKLPLRHLR